MKLKICFKDEIHRISSVPVTFKDFIQLVASTFHNQLPETWTLQYTDSDGDNILINEENDFQEFLHSATMSSALPKVYVIPSNIFLGPQVNSNLDDEYQIIELEEKNEDDNLLSETIVLAEDESEQNSKKEQKVNLVDKKSEIKEKSAKQLKTEENLDDPIPLVGDPFTGIKRAESMAFEIKGNEAFVKIEDLEKIISGVIDAKIPKFTETIKRQLDEISLSESIIIHPKKEIIADDPKAISPKVKHFGIQCQGCQINPIQGIRYKCAVCPKFDFCDKCEKSCMHPHDFIKMKQRDLLDIFRPQPVGFNNLEEKDKKNTKVDIAENSGDLSPRSSKKYLDILNEKAEKLQKCFPKEDFDILRAYINGAPKDLTIEELIENFKH